MERIKKLYYITYENNKYIVIKYPDTWAKIENPSDEVLVTFLPDENNVLLGVFNVSILIGDFLDIDSFKKTHIDTLYDMFTDFNISYKNSTTLAGREAYALLFTFRASGHTFKRLDTWTVNNGRVFLLTYQVGITYYDEYISIVRPLIIKKRSSPFLILNARCKNMCRIGFLKILRLKVIN